MSWWGKVIGGAFGFMLGGPLGALLGAVLGHHFDQGLNNLSLADDEGWEAGDQERVQAAFFTASFTVMGYIAKADGRVSASEIKNAENVMDQMQLDATQREVAIDLFNQGKKQQIVLDDIIGQLKEECGRRTNLIQFFLEIQISTALADGELHPAEQKILLQISELLGFSRFKFERLLAMALAQSRFRQHQSQSGGYRETKTGVTETQLSEAYQLLGVSSSASDDEVKKAYRRLVSQNHPDKLVSKGLPEEMMKLATQKTQEIKRAYDLISESRKNHH
jgi:DnaJ like chaperone protein